MPTPQITILSESAVSEIEALRQRNTGPSFGYTHELCVAIDALCATVKHLREHVQLLDSRWCECGHTKDKHAFFSDHDECYECDQASPDLCCEWRPVARPDTQLEHLQSQLEQLRAENERLSGLNTAARLSHREDTSMTKNYDDFRAGMLRAAEMARNEFKRAPEAAKGHDCVYMGGYEDACDHLSVVIAQAAVIDSVRIAGSQPDWQYHIALLLPDGAVEDTALLKIYQVVEHELRAAATAMRDKCVEKVKQLRECYHSYANAADANNDHGSEYISLHKASAAAEIIKALESLTLDQVKPEETNV